MANSHQISRKVHLVHVSGNTERRSFTDLLITPPHELPTSEDLEYYSDSTREAEVNFGLSPSLYFYAARAHPQFGQVSLAFAADVEVFHSGSATRFDTGGLNLRVIKTNLPDNPVARKKCVLKYTVVLARWRPNFAKFLDDFFSPPIEYWDGRPQQLDPEEIYARNSDWRCWTYEVRFSEGVPITNASAWCASREEMKNLRRGLKDLPPASPERDVVELFFKIECLSPSGTEEYCEEMEKWIRQEMES